ncbi:hypothetical protein ACFQ1I_25995 [Kitasatospora arboriphila]
MADRLAAACDLRYHDSEQPLPRAELLAAAAGCTALLTTLDDTVDTELLDAA